MLNKLVAGVLNGVTAKEIRYVPQLYSYDSSNILSYNFRSSFGGYKIFCKVTSSILDVIRKEVGDNRQLIVDTRVHMLEPNWYPCIPGWHFDEFNRPNGVLDVSNAPEQTHYTYVADFGTGSLTEFRNTEFSKEFFDALDIKDYADLNKRIENARAFTEKQGWKSEQVTVENNTLYGFNERDAHRGMPATGSGWRYFLRASVLEQNTSRKLFNEQRLQTQVYIPHDDLEKGW